MKIINKCNELKLFGDLSLQSVMEASLVKTVTTNAGTARRMNSVTILTAPV